MKDVEIKIFPNLEQLSQTAALFFSQTAAAAVAARGCFRVALSGGSTPEPLYQLLGTPPFTEQIDWSNSHLFWGDERCVPVTDPGSSFGQVRRLLLSQVPLPMGNVHRIKGELAPPAAAAEYRQRLAEVAASDRAWPRFDLVLLGLGRDGHTASLFPGPIDPRTEREPVLAVSADYDDRPAQRVTLTPPVINDARQVLFLVAGSGKAPAVRAVLEGERDAATWPAQRIAPTAGQVHWFLDQAAAADITS